MKFVQTIMTPHGHGPFLLLWERGTQWFRISQHKIVGNVWETLEREGNNNALTFSDCGLYCVTHIHGLINFSSVNCFTFSLPTLRDPGFKSSLNTAQNAHRFLQKLLPGFASHSIAFFPLSHPACSVCKLGISNSEIKHILISKEYNIIIQAYLGYFVTSNYGLRSQARPKINAKYFLAWRQPIRGVVTCTFEIDKGGHTGRYFLSLTMRAVVTRYISNLASTK
jgi:hypothetical protein